MNKKECLLVKESVLINLNSNDTISEQFTRNVTFLPTFYMPNLNINTSNGEYFCGPLIMIVKELAIKHHFR